jgi:hypothetical protein
LNATDKSQFFANKMKDMRSGNTGAATHKHLFVPGLDDLITGYRHGPLRASLGPQR